MPSTRRIRLVFVAFVLTSLNAVIVVNAAQADATTASNGEATTAKSRSVDGPVVVRLPNSGADRIDAVTLLFEGLRRVALSQQESVPGALDPGAGAVEVVSGSGARSALFSHYEYGTTIQTAGAYGHRLELFLGDQSDPPEFSVRHNGSGLGARIQARDGQDRAGFGIDMLNAMRPRLAILDDASVLPGAVLSVENGERDGAVEVAAASGGVLQTGLRVSGSEVALPIGAAIGDSAADPVRFHGTHATGRQGIDPGTVPDRLDVETATRTELVDALNAQGRAINLLRRALLDHGLIATR